MAKDDNHPYEKAPWKDPWYSKTCPCKECNTKERCGKCKKDKSMSVHPSVKPLEEKTPVLTVEEAFELYRKAKADKVTMELALRHAQAKVIDIEAKTISAAKEENRAKLTLERAFENEARKNG